MCTPPFRALGALPHPPVERSWRVDLPRRCCALPSGGDSERSEAHPAPARTPKTRPQAGCRPQPPLPSANASTHPVPRSSTAPAASQHSCRLRQARGCHPIVTNHFVPVEAKGREGKELGRGEGVPYLAWERGPELAVHEKAWEGRDPAPKIRAGPAAGGRARGRCQRWRRRVRAGGRAGRKYAKGGRKRAWGPS